MKGLEFTGLNLVTWMVFHIESVSGTDLVSSRSSQSELRAAFVSSVLWFMACSCKMCFIYVKKKNKTVHLDLIACCRPTAHLTMHWNPVNERGIRYIMHENLLLKFKSESMHWWLDLEAGLLFNCAHLRTLKDLWDFILYRRRSWSLRRP